MQRAEDEDAPEALTLALPEDASGRLDKALAEAAAALEGVTLSRARIQALMAEEAVTLDGEPVYDGAQKAKPGGVYHILIPPLASALPLPQDLELRVLFEDEHLIVVDKPAGMAAHPAPGTPNGTLVNALLHHCGASLSGIGGVARPGVVHRLDKDTSGVMVAAKTDAAHQGMTRLFSAHDIDRTYIALVRGAPNPPDGSVHTRIGRARFDRQRMAVLKEGGREAITHYRTGLTFGGTQARPLAAKVRLTLETGRTHQIRVHMAHRGAPVLGDTLYGSSPAAAPVRSAMIEAGLNRQALHAAILGFIHPITGEALRFETAPPADMTRLEQSLTAI